MRTRTKFSVAALLVSLALFVGGLTVVAQSPSTGGVFLPLEDTVVSGSWLFSHTTAPIRFEGTGADDAFETTLVAANPTADRTATLPNLTGVLGAFAAVTASSIAFEGAVDDAFETTLTVTDPTADRTFTFPNATDGTLMMSDVATNGINVANSVWGTTNGLVFEGTTADAVESQITAIDPTVADATFNLPNVGATVALFVSTLTTNNIDAVSSVWATSDNLVFEGTVADASETFITATNPTADRTVTIPDLGGTLHYTNTAQTVSAAHTYTGDGASWTGAVLAGASPLVFEGLTADLSEITFAVADPSADRTVTFANETGTVFLSTLLANAPEAANSVWAATDNLVFEVTADASETFITATNPTADRTVTIPDLSGTIHYINTAQTVSAAHAYTGDGVSWTGAVLAGASPFVFEGLTADINELTLAVGDPAADVTVTLPAATATLMFINSAQAVSAAHTFSGDGVSWTGAVLAGASPLVFEGLTADLNEMTFAVADVGADITVTFPSAGNVSYAVTLSTLTTNNVDAANSVWNASNQRVFEGAVVDASETFLTVVEPTADNTISIPNIPTGTLLVSGASANNGVIGFTQQAAAIVGASQAIALSATSLSVTCAAAASVSTITGGVAGTRVYVENFDTDCTLNDDDDPTAANAIDLTGVATNDVGAVAKMLTLYFNGSSWFQVAESDN